MASGYEAVLIVLNGEEEQSVMSEAIPAGSGVMLVTTDDPRSRRLLDFGDTLAARLAGTRPTRRHEPGAGAPHFVLPGGVRYFGVPDGQEAAPFMEAVSGLIDKPPHPLAERLSALRLPAVIRLYVSAHCPFCPYAVRSLLPLAAAQPLFRLTVVDAELFPELAERDQVKALPMLVIDGNLRWSGTIDAAEVVGMLADRDPVALGPLALEMMLKEGRAREVAGMMLDCRRVFPALVDLLVHVDWPVRLGAMVTVEELEALDADLAHAVLDRLWDRFQSAGDPARGDILYLVGEIGRPTDVAAIREFVPEDASPEVREAAEEAAEKLSHKAQS
jgi:hypothetical protein